MKKVSLALFASLMATAGLSMAQPTSEIAETNDPAAAAAIEQHAQQIQDQEAGSSASSGASGAAGSDSMGSAPVPGPGDASMTDSTDPSAMPADPYGAPDSAGASGTEGSTGVAPIPGPGDASMMDPNDPAAVPADPYGAPDSAGASGAMGAGDTGIPGAEPMDEQAPLGSQPLDGAGTGMESTTPAQ